MENEIKKFIENNKKILGIGVEEEKIIWNFTLFKGV